MQNRQSFELLISVQPADIDELGHVNNTVYLRWVQEVATAHWRTLAPLEDQHQIVWIALRHEIDYKTPAFLRDTIILKTCVGTAEGLRFERHTEILRQADRQLFAQARTLWCPVDPQSGRPKRVSPKVRQLFSQS